jgi:probable rRNA maturation factor
MDVLWKCRRVVVGQDELDALVDAVEKGEKRRFEASLTVVDDEEMRRVNREALGHDYATDVVTFDLSDADGDAIEGEIVVSADHAAAAAAAAGHDAETELLFYVCHGLLHLAGHDDKTPTMRRRMLARQARYLKGLGRDVRG